MAESPSSKQCRSDILFAHTSDSVCCVCLCEEDEPRHTLLHCNVCQLTVHAACYNQPDDMVKLSQRKMWNCERCSSTSRMTPVCVFCNEKRLEMPFMKTTDGRWAHISCGQCINEAFFSGDKNEIDVSHVKWAPRTQVCLICDKKRGICIQCAWPKCAKYHHLACARAEGLHSFLNQQTFNVNTFCAAHTAEKRRKMMRRKTSNGKDKDVSSPTSSNKRARHAASDAGGVCSDDSASAASSSSSSASVSSAAADRASLASGGRKRDDDDAELEDEEDETNEVDEDDEVEDADAQDESDSDADSFEPAQWHADEDAAAMAALNAAVTSVVQHQQRPMAVASTPLGASAAASAATPSFRFANLLPTAVVSALRRTRPNDPAFTPLPTLVSAAARRVASCDDAGNDSLDDGTPVAADAALSSSSASPLLDSASPRSDSSASTVGLRDTPFAATAFSFSTPAASAAAPSSAPSSPASAALFEPHASACAGAVTTVAASSTLSPLRLAARPDCSTTEAADAAAETAAADCGEVDEIGVWRAWRNSHETPALRKSAGDSTTPAGKKPLYVTPKHALWFAAQVLPKTDQKQKQKQQQSPATESQPTAFTLPLLQRMSEQTRASVDIPTTKHPLVASDSVECADLCALSVSLAQSQQRILASYAAPSSSAAVAASTSLEARLFESDTRMVAALQRQMHAVHAMLRSSSSATA